MTGGGEGFWSKRHETVTRGGGGSKIFWNPQSAILTFSHSFFYDVPMNLVAFVQDSQNRIVFDIDTFIANIIFGNRRFRFSQL